MSCRRRRCRLSPDEVSPRPSKVRMLTDALRMLGEVWSVRQAALDGTYSPRPQLPIAQPAATAVLADPLLPAPPTTAGF